MKAEKFIYRVSFKDPPLEGSDKTDFFFTTQAAIYEVFPSRTVGIGLKNLWNKGVSDGKVYEGRKARITRESLWRKLAPHGTKRPPADDPADNPGADGGTE